MGRLLVDDMMNEQREEAHEVGSSVDGSDARGGGMFVIVPPLGKPTVETTAAPTTTVPTLPDQIWGDQGQTV